MPSSRLEPSIDKAIYGDSETPCSSCLHVWYVCECFYSSGLCTPQNKYSGLLSLRLFLFVFLRLHSNVLFICSARLYSAAGVRSVKSCFRLWLLQGTMTSHKSANLNRFGTQFTPRFQFFVDVGGQANSRCEEQDWQWKSSNQTCFEDEYL